MEFDDDEGIHSSKQSRVSEGIRQKANKNKT